MSIVSKKDALGHRARARLRFESNDFRSAQDDELLEILLFYAIPRADTKQIARKLLKRYESFADILNAPEVDLRKVEGIGDASVFLFKLLKDLHSRLFVAKDLKSTHVLNNWVSVLNYCKLVMGYNNTEQFRVLYLNKKNYLIADEVNLDGTIDRIQVYPREIVRKALEHSAAAVILVHNHPSTDSNPSPDDLEITNCIAAALRTIGVIVHDHVIVTSRRHFSFKMNGLL